jgi:5-(carboxyamino)imidazole ribonucleotide synthase
VTTVGVIGAGQLGRMLGFAGRALDLEFVFLGPAPDPPAGAAGRIIRSPYDSETGLALLAEQADVVTYEFENVPLSAAHWLAGRVPVFPPARALQHAQDRLAEKELFAALDIPAADYRAVDSEEDLRAAVAALGLPLVLKTRRLGYDGKGQVTVRSNGELGEAWRQLAGKPLIAERLVSFDREVSIIGTRRRGGETALFPLIENRHSRGILRTSQAPAEGQASEHAAQRYLERVLEHLDYVGVLALELFEVGDRLLANEFAPRVHNSGHWTIEGAKTSQFENHLRAILDLPLGDTGAVGHAGMVNLIGTRPQDSALLEAAGFQVHDYGKMARPGRKLGHVTTVAESAAERDRRLSDALKILEN